LAPLGTFLKHKTSIKYYLMIRTIVYIAMGLFIALFSSSDAIFRIAYYLMFIDILIFSSPLNMKQLGFSNIKYMRRVILLIILLNPSGLNIVINAIKHSY
jgi:uncharacterized membrane protein YgdD (TMEM256/DUF423 family)